MINIRKARNIIKGTFAKAHEMGLKPLTVVVLDTGGHVIAAEREDGASPGRFDIARGKAYGCIMIGLPGSALNDRAESQHYFMTAMNGLYGGKVVPVQGGILVKDKRGAIIGAVGVTGDTSENDAEAGMAGLEKAGLEGVA